MPSDKRSEVGPVAELKTDSPKTNNGKQAELEKRENAHEPCAEFHATNVDEGNDEYRGDRDYFDPYR